MQFYDGGPWHCTDFLKAIKAAPTASNSLRSVFRTDGYSLAAIFAMV